MLDLCVIEVFGFFNVLIIKGNLKDDLIVLLDLFLLLQQRKVCGLICHA